LRIWWFPADKENKGFCLKMEKSTRMDNGGQEKPRFAVRKKRSPCRVIFGAWGEQTKFIQSSVWVNEERGKTGEFMNKMNSLTLCLNTYVFLWIF